MSNSTNFFQLVAEFQKHIDWLNQILKGGEADTIVIDGVVKPAISKDIADKWSAISAMVQGRLASDTVANLPTPPPSGTVLAEVWKDPDGIKNGLYGWTGTVWEKSPYDPIKYSTDAVNAVYDKTRIFGNTKRHKNVLPHDAIMRYLYHDTPFRNEHVKVIPDNDNAFLSQAGIKFGAQTNSFPVEMSDVLTGMAGKKATFGYFCYSPDGTHADFAGGSWLKEKDGALSTIYPDERGYIDLGDNIFLMWAKATVPSDHDTVMIRQVISGYAPTYFSFAPFIAFDDDYPLWEDIDVLNAGTSLPNDVLVDMIGANNVGDYDGPNTYASKSDLSVITDIVPNGSCWKFPAISSADAIVKYDFEGAQVNQWWHVSYYVYCEDPSRMPRTIIYLKDGTKYVVIDLKEYFVDIVRTPITDTLFRYDISGKYIHPHTDTYGIWIGHKFGSGNSDAYMFGYQAAAASKRHERMALHPTAWVPKYTPVLGYAASSESTEKDSIWYGKKIVWLGTSIPAGSGYPEQVAAQLGVSEIINLSIGGGALRAFLEDKTWFDSNILHYKFTLSKADVQTEFGGNIGFEVNPKDYSERQPNSGITLNQDMIDDCVKYNYENRLLPHLDADYIIFDYGVNDRGGQTSFPWMMAKDAGKERHEFAGAFNFLYDWLRVEQAKLGKKTQIIVITHHNRGDYSSTTWGCVESQLDIARHIGSRVVNLADNLGLNSQNLMDWISDGLHPEKNGPIAKAMARQITDSLQRL